MPQRGHRSRAARHSNCPSDGRGGGSMSIYFLPVVSERNVRRLSASSILSCSIYLDID
jgi:hypothetical protein